ncbi:MAG: hypothetical protein K2I06_02865 [Ruminococcus sp.]|nr:hypothetical protein [Ruminococcus sp.]
MIKNHEHQKPPDNVVIIPASPFERVSPPVDDTPGNSSQSSISSSNMSEFSAGQSTDDKHQKPPDNVVTIPTFPFERVSPPVDDTPGNSSQSSTPVSNTSEFSAGQPPGRLPQRYEEDSRKKWFLNFCQFLQKNKKMIYYINSFYFFNEWFYEPDDINKIKIQLSQMVASYDMIPIAYEIDFVYRQLKITPIVYDQNNIPNHPDYFLYRNGIVNVQNNQLYSITSDYFATGAINANFNPQLCGQHPCFDKLLTDIAGDDYELLQRLWEFVAYVLSPEFRKCYIFCLIGVGGAGKSLLLSIICSLLTPSLVANLSISNLVGSRFALSEISGKRICVASDEGNFHFSANHAALLKRISGGGEQITTDVKGKSQITFISTAKLIIASNHSIHIAAGNIDSYLKNRMLVIPFTNPIPLEQQDPNMLTKILAERDAIVTDAYFVYKTLQANHFIFSGNNQKYDHIAAEAALETNSDALAIFTRKYCIFDGESFTATETLYEAYQAAFSNAPYKDTTAFSRAFLKLNADRVQQTRHHSSESNQRGFYGVALK